MYRAHFGLRELPFGITPDTGFFFACPTYQEALNTLLVAAKTGEGFIKITGEVGVGKTLLCRKFMATLDKSFVTAYIPNPFLEPRTLLMALSDELQIPLEKDAAQYHLLKSINHRLLILAREGKRVLLCLDEAQAMPLETLEALRLLTNLETGKRKLLQIVMFGQPELDRKLQQEAIRQLNQRITFQYRLRPLTRDDMEVYVSHRLTVAGFAGSRLFTHGAVKALYAASSGIPRVVNILAHKSMMLTFGEGKREVSARHVKAAADDTGVSNKRSWPWLWITAIALLAASTSMGWAYFR
jgi:MSHA biogenesis protein MshM